MSEIELSVGAATTFPRSDAVLAVDLSGTVIYVNRAVEVMTGRVRNDLLGHPLAYLFETAESADRRVSPWILSESSAEFIHDRDGCVAGAIIVFQDVASRCGVQSKSIESCEPSRSGC